MLCAIIVFTAAHSPATAASKATKATKVTKAPKEYQNPILSGFYPDPSICRKGDDFYLVNSSFEWYPGVPIHKSKDLVNWELIGYAVKSSVGYTRVNAFAPTIRYHDGLFYMIVTFPGGGGNFYVTAEDPAGEWSEPVWLDNTPGIDPSLFWDDDGRCYYIGQTVAKPREWLGHNHIYMQELDLKQRKLVGERKNLTTGHAANAMWTEGAHLYKIDGKYILLLAEGGTGYYHAVTIFHSDTLWGTYTPDHANPIITHRHLGVDYPLYAVGHADFVDTPNGEWWMVALGKRLKSGHTYLSRETFLLPMTLERREASINEERSGYNTIIVNKGKGVVPDRHPLPKLPWTPVKVEAPRDDFDGEELALPWNFRSIPTSRWHSLSDGWLTIDLRPEVASKKSVSPSLIAKRFTDYAFEVTTKMEFEAQRDSEQAGVILYRNDLCYATLTKQGGDIVLQSRLLGREEELFRAPYDGSIVVLRMRSDGENVVLSYGKSERRMRTIECSIPLAIVADLAQNNYNGPMVGIYATSNGKPSQSTARFDWFEYIGL